MSAIVVDASVAAKWFFEEVQTSFARKLLSRSENLHAPDFFLIEMDNIFWKKTRREDITVEEVDAARTLLREIPIQYHTFFLLLDAAFDIANQTGNSVYDSLYIALAVRLNGRTVTADRKLVRALEAGPFAEHVIWIEDVA